MNEVESPIERPPERLRGRGRRSLNLSTKLTTDEARAVEEAASRAGKAPSEWARDLLFRSEAVGKSAEMEMHIFTELVVIEDHRPKDHKPLYARGQGSASLLSALQEYLAKN